MDVEMNDQCVTDSESLVTMAISEYTDLECFARPTTDRLPHRCRAELQKEIAHEGWPHIHITDERPHIPLSYPCVSNKLAYCAVLVDLDMGTTVGGGAETRDQSTLVGHDGKLCAQDGINLGKSEDAVACSVESLEHTVAPARD